MIADRFHFRAPHGAHCDNDHFQHLPRHHVFDFDVFFTSFATFGIAENIGSAGGTLDLTGIGNVIVGDATSTAAVSIHSGQGLSTIVLGNGDEHISLNGAFNTVVLGDGNDVVNVGTATGMVSIYDGEVHVAYQNLMSATFAAPRDIWSFHSLSGGHGNIGFFNGGSGNIGAFNGLGNSSASDGNGNIGVFNGDGNGGTYNGNDNIGAFNGNLNGLGNTSRSDGHDNGNGNIGVLNGNYNGDLNTGIDSGNHNGNGNIGLDSGNLNGNGVPSVALPGGQLLNLNLVGGFDTVVAGNGSDTITAMAGVSTIVAGNGNDTIRIGGSYNTVVAGNGANHVTGVDVDHSMIVLGDGGNTVSLSGAGFNFVSTGSGNDVITLSGNDNWVNAGAASTFNTIFGSAGKDTFVLAQAGMDKIFNFSVTNGDQVDLQNILSGTHFRDLNHVLSTQIIGANTLLDYTNASGVTTTVAELMNTHYTLSMLEGHGSLLV